MSRKLVYLFGPDGAGKSTLAGSLSAELPASGVIHGSTPATWPDTSWHREILANGIDPATRDPSFHFTTLKRCYAMIGSLLRGHDATDTEPLVIDSDPRAQIAVKACTLHGHPTPLPEFYAQLDALASCHINDDTIRQVGVHVTLGRGTAESRAAALVQRIDARNDLSSFDPTSIEQASALVLAFDALETILLERATTLVRVETDQAFDPRALAAQINAY